MSFESTLKDMERLAVAKRPERSGFHVAVSDEVISAVGFITLQWAALYETVLVQIDLLREHPSIPPELAAAKPDYRQETNITYLRKLGAIAYANEREGAVELFDQNICHIFTLKADRDKVAHGGFALMQSYHGGISGHYNGKPFKMTVKRLRAVAEGIARCNAFLLFDFGPWVSAPKGAPALRAWLEKRAQQGPEPPSRPSDSPHTQ